MSGPEATGPEAPSLEAPGSRPSEDRPPLEDGKEGGAGRVRMSKDLEGVRRLTDLGRKVMRPPQDFPHLKRPAQIPVEPVQS